MSEAAHVIEAETFTVTNPATLEEAARTWPVKQSIHPVIETVLVFDWA